VGSEQRPAAARAVRDCRLSRQAWVTLSRGAAGQLDGCQILTRKVFLIGNALIPGYDCPSAAPGLRVFGLERGLAGNGVEATIVLPRRLVDSQFARWQRGSALVQGTAAAVVLDSTEIMDYVVSHGPATVLMTNWSSASLLKRHPTLRIGMDFFSATVLEHRYRSDRQADVDRVIVNKRKAIDLAEFFFVNGSRRIPYCHAWVASSGRDVRNLEMPAVNMSLPFDFKEPSSQPREEIRLCVAGYNQAWAPLGPVLAELELLAGRLPIEVDVVTAGDYWSDAENCSEYSSVLNRLRTNSRFRIHPPMTYNDLGAILKRSDAFVDLFVDNVERQYSMSTRAVVALAHGVPVVHPGFTEVGEWIERFNAGWTSECGIGGAGEFLERALLEIVRNPDVRSRKSLGAIELASKVFNPVREARKLLPLL